MAFTLNGSFVEQTGTNTSLAGIEALAGVTLTTLGDLRIYDMGSLHLRIDGNLTINNTDTGFKEILVIGTGGGSSNIDVHVRNGGTLTIGLRASQGVTEFSSSGFFPSIFEKDSLTFGTSSAKATAGQTTLGASGNKGFLVVDTGGSLNWYGCICASGGIGFDGVGNDITAPSTNSTIRIRDGVLDARRVTSRSAVGDQFIYQYSGDFEVEGWTLVSSENTDLGVTLILIEPPVLFKGYKPIMTEAAFSGSTTVPLDAVFEVEDYAGIVGEGNVDGILVASQDQQQNTAVFTFLNSALGSTLNLVATQTYAVNQVMARQLVTATAVDSVGTAITDAVLATENVNDDIFQNVSGATAAQATFTLATQPSNGDQFFIDGKAYTYQSSLTNSDGNIAIGADLSQTQQRTVAAINLSGSAGTDYAASTTLHPTVSAATFSANNSVLTAKAPSDAGNDIKLKRDFTSINNFFDYNKMGVTNPGSDLAQFNVGRLLMTEWNPDGGTTNPPIPTRYNPSGTDDDLWSFYLYSYGFVERSRIDVLLRGIGGTQLEFIVPNDLNITESDRITVDAYSDMRNIDRVYDRAKSFKVDNVGIPSLEQPIVQAAGNIVDFGSLDVILDGDAAQAFDANATTVTLNSVQIPTITRIGATEAVSSGEDDEITINFPGSIQDDDVAILIVGHAQSDENTWNTPSGWTLMTDLQSPAAVSRPGVTVYRRILSGDSGSVTVTNAGSNTSGIVAQMIVYRDVDITGVTPVTTTGASGDPDAGTATVDDGDFMLVVGFMDDGNQSAPTSPSSYTTILDTATTDGAGVGE